MRLVVSYVISLDTLLPFWKLNFFVLDNKVHPKNAASDFATVLAVADVAAALGAEEIVVIDADSDCAAQAVSFHPSWLRLSWMGLSRLVFSVLSVSCDLSIIM